MSNDGIYFECIDLNFLCCKMRSFAVIVETIMSVHYRLREHSKPVKFEKRAAKTLQHGHRYGDIRLLYDMIGTYDWF